MTEYNTWFKKADKLPETDQRVLVYSSGYSDTDPMQYRVVAGQFVKNCTDVDAWMIPQYLEEKILDLRGTNLTKLPEKLEYSDIDVHGADSLKLL